MPYRKRGGGGGEVKNNEHVGDHICGCRRERERREERERERERDRQTDRQTDRDRQTETDRQRNGRGKGWVGGPGRTDARGLKAGKTEHKPKQKEREQEEQVLNPSIFTTL